MHHFKVLHTVNMAHFMRCATIGVIYGGHFFWSQVQDVLWSLPPESSQCRHLVCWRSWWNTTITHMDLSWVVQTGRLKHRNCPKVGTECTADAETIVHWNLSSHCVFWCSHSTNCKKWLLFIMCVCMHHILWAAWLPLGGCQWNFSCWLEWQVVLRSVMKVGQKLAAFYINTCLHLSCIWVNMVLKCGQYCYMYCKSSFLLPSFNRYQCAGGHTWSSTWPSSEHARFPVQELTVSGHRWGGSDIGYRIWRGNEADHQPFAQWVEWVHWHTCRKQIFLAKFKISTDVTATVAIFWNMTSHFDG